MISIIICSRNNIFLNKLKTNLKEFSKFKNEIIVIDNSKNNYSIFEAYNLGLQKVSKPVICFLHEDVLIKTQNWDEILLQIFNKDSKIGLLGIAGSFSKSVMPSAWWDCPEKDRATFILQHYNDGRIELINYGFNKGNIKEVTVIDGVFMVVRKNLNIQFDETIKGFHCYDLDLALKSIKKGYKNIVTNAILVEHFSIGSLNEHWLNTSFYYHQKNHELIKTINRTNRKLEIENAKKFIKLNLKLKNNRIAFNTWKKMFFNYPLLKFHFMYIFLICFKK